jgi:hypothetical protein
MEGKLKFKLTLSVFIIIITTSAINSEVTRVHNTLKEIEASIGKVELKLMRTWGNDEEDDTNKFFKDPTDIAIGKNGLLYICISGLHCIRVFDSAGNYKFTIGKRGQGPTDFLNPKTISFDNQGNIVVTDSGNGRVQVLTPEGKYVKSWKFKDGYTSDLTFVSDHNEHIALCLRKSFALKNLLYVYNSNGDLIRSIGHNFDQSKEFGNSQGIYYTMNSLGNIYISFGATPCLLMYTFQGNMQIYSSFEMPFKASSVTLDKEKNRIVMGNEIKNPVSRAISSDSKGRIYLVTNKRPFNQREIKATQFVGIYKRGSGIFRKPNEVTVEETDLYRLLIFDPKGKIIAASQLNVICERIYVHGKRLFVIDTLNSMSIYEYEVSFL